MASLYDKSDIPVLTVQAEVPQQVQAPLPVVTQVVMESGKLPLPSAAGPTPAEDPLVGLRAALEQLTQKAVEEAMANLRIQLERELPRLIERILQNQRGRASASDVDL